MATSAYYDSSRAQVRASMVGSDHKTMLREAATKHMKADM